MPAASSVSREEIESHLNVILASEAFAHSKRCCGFLRFVVDRTLRGDSESIKERTLGTEVFGRNGDYDPSQDSVVRVKAGEVRKRLQRFYEVEGRQSPMRIELPLGSYVPRFQLVRADTSGAVPPHYPQRRRVLAAAAFALALAAVALGMAWNGVLPSPTPPVDRMWDTVLSQKSPLLICLPVLPATGSKAPTGDRVGLGAAYAAAHLAAFCAVRRHPYLLKMGGELNFSDLRNQPAVLLGAFSSNWTLLMNRGLRFELAHDGTGGKIIDSRSGREFHAANWRPDGHADADYAIAARLFDSQSGQLIFLAAGITTFGTQSAAEFMLSPVDIAHLLSTAPPRWSQRNFQALISTKIIGNTPGPPNLIAADFW